MDSQKQRRDLAAKLEDAIVQLKSLQQENKQLRDQLYIDDLTGIGNRRVYEESFDDLVELAHSSHEPLALLIADVDGLKRTNDSLGHAKGDELLKTIAKSLKDTSRDTDMVGRMGGDEFYVILPGFSPMQDQPLDELLEQTVQRYKTALKKTVAELALAEDLYVNVSFGIAILNPQESSSDFYHRVDQIAQYNKKMFYEKIRKKGFVAKDSRL